MDVFTYEWLREQGTAIKALRDDRPGSHGPRGRYGVANWLKEGIVRPTRRLAINGLPGMGDVEADGRGLRVSARWCAWRIWRRTPKSSGTTRRSLSPDPPA